jgi:hypothetical protein
MAIISQSLLDVLNMVRKTYPIIFLFFNHTFNQYKLVAIENGTKHVWPFLYVQRNEYTVM